MGRPLFVFVPALQDTYHDRAVRVVHDIEQLARRCPPSSCGGYVPAWGTGAPAHAGWAATRRFNRERRRPEVIERAGSFIACPLDESPGRVGLFRPGGAERLGRRRGALSRGAAPDPLRGRHRARPRALPEVLRRAPSRMEPRCLTLWHGRRNRTHRTPWEGRGPSWPATSSRRMRRTSSIVSGLSWVEWLEWTTFSEATPSRCALSYRTTPSV
jgi:hypothetical protein